MSVALCSVWFKVPWREQAFISWAGLRGAVPIIMATVPLAAGAPSAERISEEVLVFVVVFTLVQGPSLPWVARKLGMVDDAAALDIEVEVVPLDRIQADFMQVKVPDGSKLHGVTIGELRLPRFTVISVILRDGHPLVPSALDRIQAGDELMVVVPSASRAVTEKRFREGGVLRTPGPVAASVTGSGPTRQRRVTRRCRRSSCAGCTPCRRATAPTNWAALPRRVVRCR